jgi:DNA-binding NarL/FixJ family response regulator
MMSRKTVFVSSNYSIFQRGLERMLHQCGQIDIVGRSANRETVERVKVLKPDVVILDSTGMTGDLISNILRILSLHPVVKVIHMTLYHNRLSVYQFNPHMAAGYQVSEWKVEGITDLVKALDDASPVAQPANV